MTTLQRLFIGILSLLLIQTISGQSALDASNLAIEATNQNNEAKLIFQQNGLNGNHTISINGESIPLEFKDGQAIYTTSTNREGKLLRFGEGRHLRIYHLSAKKNGDLRFRHIPLWLSVFPPLLAIILALLFKEVVIALFVGVWSGAFIAGGLRWTSLYYWLLSFWESLSKYCVNALADTGHLSVIVFSLMIGGMVAIISKNGGMAGVVKSLSKYATSPKSAQFITWLLGIAIFFDDYANTLIVGNTMRKVTDGFKISRAKLAYIVDSTAAPVSAVAFITTWIGAELGYIDSGMKLLEGIEIQGTAYAIFLSSLKYSFYPILALVFILLLIYTGYEYGPMFKAERNARRHGVNASKEAVLEDEEFQPVEGAPKIWWHAAVPIFVVIGVTVFGLIQTGMSYLYEKLLAKNLAVNESWNSIWANIQHTMNTADPSFFEKLGQLIGHSDSYTALLWSSLSGVATALLISLAARIMNIRQSMYSIETGFKAMLPAVLILTLAWALAGVTEELHTADFISNALTGHVNPRLFPAIIFVLAAVISFSTGSSWSTMAILYPIAIPTMWTIGLEAGLPQGEIMQLFLNVVATVLGASVLGDHCSPISDTTILSSLASGCNHIEHVRTQLPYALTTGGLSLLSCIIVSFLSGGWGLSIIVLALSIGACYLIIKTQGKPVDS